MRRGGDKGKRGGAEGKGEEKWERREKRVESVERRVLWRERRVERGEGRGEGEGEGKGDQYTFEKKCMPKLPMQGSLHVREKAVWRSMLKRRLCTKEKAMHNGEGCAQGGGPHTRV